MYSKDIYAADNAKMRIAMSYQSAAIGIAVIFGFALGGVASNSFGVRGNAIVGLSMCGINLISLAYFLVAPPNSSNSNANSKIKSETISIPEDGEGTGEGEDALEPTPKKGFFFRKTAIIKSIEEGSSEKVMMNRYSESEEINSSHLTYLVALVFSLIPLLLVTCAPLGICTSWIILESQPVQQVTYIALVLCVLPG